MKLKIALLQMNPVEKNIEKNIKIAKEFCRNAAKKGAHFAVFPEMFNIGYPMPYKGTNAFKQWKEVAFNNKKADPDNLIPKYRSFAIEDNHPYVNDFRSLAKELEMAIAITYMSKGTTNPRNTVLVIDRYGKDLLKYSKIHLFAPFMIDAICEPGEKFIVKELDTQVGKIKLGALICADRDIPEPARILMKKGAELVIIPNSCPLLGLNGIVFDTVKVRAFENAMGIVICNYPSPKNDGGSAAFYPDGSVLFKADHKEDVHVIDYDIAKLRQYRKETACGDAFREEIYFKNIRW